MNPISLEKNNSIMGNFETHSTSISDQLMELGSAIDEVVSFDLNDFLDEDMFESASSNLNKESIAVQDEGAEQFNKSIEVTNKGAEKLTESIEVTNEGTEVTNEGTEEKKEGLEIKNVTEVHVQENSFVQLNAVTSINIAQIIVQTGEHAKVSSIEALSITKIEFKNTYVTENNKWVLLTESKNKNVKDRITFDEFGDGAVVSRHGKYKIGDQVTSPSGKKYTVTRFETDEEEKVFDKNWTVFLLALQRYEAETRQNKTNNEKPKAKEVSLEQRIHRIPVQTAKPSNDSSETIEEIRKNDYKEADKQNMDRADANQKSSLKSKIKNEEGVKTKIKEHISAKNLKMDIIYEYNKICNKVITELTSILDTSNNFLKKNHTLCQLPIKTTNKKFVH